MTKQTRKRWDARLQAEVWLKSDVNAYCKLMNDIVNDSSPWARRNGKEPNNYKLAVEKIFTEHCNGKKQLTKEQTEFGIEWLKTYAFKKNGEPRQQKTNPLRNRERTIIKNFSHFEFRGAYDLGNNNWGAHRPIYRTYAKDGSFFDYIPGSWGNWGIEIV